jgi:hypothetical protein
LCHNETVSPVVSLQTNLLAYPYHSDKPPDLTVSVHFNITIVGLDSSDRC